MEELIKGGASVVLVSHNLDTIKNYLTSKGCKVWRNDINENSQANHQIYIYFELFQLFRCIVKYTYHDQQLDVELINNTDHEVLLKTDDLEFAVEKIEELYIETIRNNLS